MIPFKLFNRTEELFLPRDLEHVILSYLSVLDIIPLVDTRYWEERVYQEFKIPVNFFRETSLPPPQRYLQLLTLRGGVDKGSESYENKNLLFERALDLDSPELADYFIGKGCLVHSNVIERQIRKGRWRTVLHFSENLSNYYSRESYRRQIKTYLYLAQKQEQTDLSNYFAKLLLTEIS